MPPPRTAVDLQSFIASANWLRNSIVDYSRIVESLSKLLTTVLAGKGRKSSKAAKVPLALSGKHLKCFDAVKHSIAKSAHLAYLDPNAEFILMTNASVIGWRGILMQIVDYDPGKSWEEQNSYLLAFLCGTFRHSQLNWKILDKECFAIVESVQKLRYLLIRTKPFRILCDDKNLVYLFEHHTAMKVGTSQRLQRWMVILAGYRYRIEHIWGPDNLWADQLSRWGQAPQLSSLAAMVTAPEPGHLRHSQYRALCRVCLSRSARILDWNKPSNQNRMTRGKPMTYSFSHRSLPRIQFTRNRGRWARRTYIVQYNIS